jgi:hypothetical protein
MASTQLRRLLGSSGASVVRAGVAGLVYFFAWLAVHPAGYGCTRSA